MKGLPEVRKLTQCIDVGSLRRMPTTTSDKIDDYVAVSNNA